MQQIQNALSNLTGAGDAKRVDTTSLGPSVSELGEKSTQKQQDAGFDRVLKQERSQAESKQSNPSDHASGQTQDGSSSTRASSDQEPAQQPQNQQAANTAEDSSQDGKIMPPAQEALPPDTPVDGAQHAGQLLPATQLASAQGRDSGEAAKQSETPLQGNLIADGGDARRGSGAADAEITSASAARGIASGLPEQAAAVASAAKGAGGNGEAAREAGRDFGLDVKASNQVARPEGRPDVEADARLDDLTPRELQGRKAAVRDRIELAPTRVADAALETQSARPTASSAPVAPIADLASAARPGLGQPAGMEPPVGARIAVGQEGWSQLIAQRIANLAARGSQGAEIQLDPPELGPIKVTIQMSGDQTASVTVQSHSQAVRDALEQSAHRLRDLFTQSGLDLSSLDVSDQGLPRGHSDAQEEAGSGSPRTSGQPERDELAPAAGSQMTVVIPDQTGRIDFYV